MSKSKNSKAPVQSNKTDLEIFNRLSPAQKHILNKELQNFSKDFTAQECEYFMHALLWSILDTDHPIIKRPFVRHNSDHFIGRVTILLKNLIPPTHGRKSNK